MAQVRAIGAIDTKAAGLTIAVSAAHSVRVANGRSVSAVPRLGEADHRRVQVRQERAHPADGAGWSQAPPDEAVSRPSPAPGLRVHIVSALGGVHGCLYRRRRRRCGCCARAARGAGWQCCSSSICLALWGKCSDEPRCCETSGEVSCRSGPPPPGGGGGVAVLRESIANQVLFVL